MLSKFLSLFKSALPQIEPPLREPKYIELSPFGFIDINNLVGSSYHAEIEIDSKNVEVDINFEVASVSLESLGYVGFILNKFPEFVVDIHDSIRSDYNSESASVSNYIEFHEDMMSEFANGNIDLVEVLISVLTLKRIGFYFNEKGHHAVIDLALPDGKSDYLLVVYVNPDATIIGLEVES